MANTPTQAIPYCAPSDAPDVPYWSQRQAERTAALFDAADTSRAKLPGQIVSGSDSIAIGAGAASITKVITLPPGFSAPPFVVLQNTANVAGRASLLGLYVNSTTKDQFTVKMQTADNAAIGTSYTIVFNWLASL